MMNTSATKTIPENQFRHNGAPPIRPPMAARPKPKPARARPVALPTGPITLVSPEAFGAADCLRIPLEVCRRRGLRAIDKLVLCTLAKYPVPAAAELLGVDPARILQSVQKLVAGGLAIGVEGSAGVSQ
jgi:hypothetical protein